MPMKVRTLTMESNFNQIDGPGPEQGCEVDVAERS